MSNTPGISDHPDIRELARSTLFRNKSRPAKVDCIRCGYNLEGTPVGGNCPECGLEVSRTILKLTKRPQWHARTARRVGASRRANRRAAVMIVVASIGFLFLMNTCSL